MSFSGRGAASGAASGASAGAVFGPWGAAIGGVGGGLVGGFFSGDDERKRAEQERRAALEYLMNINAEAGPTAYEGVNADPRLVLAQKSVLDRLMKEGTTSGLGLQDRAALTEAQNQVSARERGSREAILQDMSQRGMSGSGSELAAALTNQQGAADRSSMAGTQAAAAARQRQLQALAQSGEFASGMRSQDFGEQAQKASARDALAQFNASARLNKAGMVSGTRIGNAASTAAQGQRDDLFGAGAARAAGTAGGYAANYFLKRKPNTGYDGVAGAQFANQYGSGD